MKIIRYILFATYILLIVIMGIATFVEHAHGTEYAQATIYHSWWFFGLWALLAVALIPHLSYLISHPSSLLHLSFLVILLGAAVSYFTSKEGTISLRKGVPQQTYYDGKQMRLLPFTIVLDSFAIKHYPGTTAPADFVSYVRIQVDKLGEVDELTSKQVDKLSEESNNSSTRQLVNLSTEESHNLSTRQLVNLSTKTISMNNPLKHDGYRLFQSSYDRDLQGSILTLRYDPWGTPITYAGYLMLLIGAAVCFFKKSRKLFPGVKECRSAGAKTHAWNAHPTAILLFVILSSALLYSCTPSLLKASSSLLHSHLPSSGGAGRGFPKSLPTINSEKAERVARMQVIYNDRPAPFNTLASDVMRKVYGSTAYHGLTAEQVVYGWMARPEVWQHEPMIKIKDKGIRRQLGIDGHYASLAEAAKHTGHLATDPAWRTLDEKMGILLMIANGTLIKPLPEGVTPLSDLQVDIELAYNAIPFNRLCFITSLSLGVLSLALILMRRRWKIMQILLWTECGFVFAYCAMRYCISGRLPLASGYETMLFMTLCVLLISAISVQRSTPNAQHAGHPLMLPFGFLLAGFTMLVAHLSNQNPQITPLMPVLSSPLLTLHVSIIMMSYALLSFTFVMACCRVVMMNGLLMSGNHSSSQHLHHFNIGGFLRPAVLLLALGIFLGAVWANVSWGRYWSWDPKEVWALITLMVYAVPLHRRSLPFLQKPLCYHLYIVFAFLTVLMTYFGVNYFLGGMHSYA